MYMAFHLSYMCRFNFNTIGCIRYLITINNYFDSEQLTSGILNFSYKVETSQVIAVYVHV